VLLIVIPINKKEHRPIGGSLVVPSRKTRSNRVTIASDRGRSRRFSAGKYNSASFDFFKFPPLPSRGQPRNRPASKDVTRQTFARSLSLIVLQLYRHMVRPAASPSQVHFARVLRARRVSAGRGKIPGIDRWQVPRAGIRTSSSVTQDSRKEKAQAGARAR